MPAMETTTDPPSHHPADPAAFSQLPGEESYQGSYRDPSHLVDAPSQPLDSLRQAAFDRMLNRVPSPAQEEKNQLADEESQLEGEGEGDTSKGTTTTGLGALAAGEGFNMTQQSSLGRGDGEVKQGEDFTREEGGENQDETVPATQSDRNDDDEEGQGTREFGRALGSVGAEEGVTSADAVIEEEEDEIEDDPTPLLAPPNPSPSKSLSGLELDDPDPSSSPAVERDLLPNRRGVSRGHKAYQSLILESSSNGSARSASASGSRNGLEMHGTWDGPITSTPANLGAPPPQPLSAAPSSRNPIANPPPQSAAQHSLTSGKITVENSSPPGSDMAGEEDEDEGRDTTVIELGGGEKSMDLDELEEEEEDELSEEQDASRVETPRPTAERTMDMDIDDENSQSQSQLVPRGIPTNPLFNPESQVSLDDSIPFQNDASRSSQKEESNVVEGEQDVDKSEKENDPGNGSDEESQIDLENRRLSAIGDLQSSMEEPSQIEIEPTQAHEGHDIEKHNRRQASSAPSSHSNEGPSRSLPRFAYETENSTTGRAVRIPTPRILRRVPPPPSSDSAPSSILPGAVSPTQIEGDENEETDGGGGDPVAGSSLGGESLDIPLARLPRTRSSPIPSPVESSAAPPAISSSVSSSNRLPLPVPLTATGTTSSPNFIPDSVSSGLSRNSPAPSNGATHLDGSGPVPGATQDMIIEDSTVGMTRIEEGELEPEAEVEMEETEIEEESQTVEKSKGKGKGKVIVTYRSPTRKTAGSKKDSPATGKKAPTPTRIDKGKGRAARSPSPANESADVLNLLQHDDDLPETNYEIPPHLAASKRTSRRSSGGSARSSVPSPAPARVASTTTSARGRKRKMDSTTAAAEAEEDDNADAETAMPPPPPTKRSKPTPSTSKPTAKKSALAKTKIPRSKSTATTAKRAKTGSRSSTTSQRSHSRTPSAPPIPGSSRAVRFDSVDEVLRPDGRRSTEPAGGGDVRRISISKLPASAPFKRVFCRWPKDKFFYPGTIISVSKGKVAVEFDDQSKATLSFSELRRCELERGDWVFYRGDEAMETETQQVALAQDVRVMRVERGLSGEDYVGELAPDDIIVATKPHVALADQADVKNKERLNVNAICVPENRSAQFDNRKLSLDDIAGLEGRAKFPPTLLPIPPFPVATPFTVNKRKGIFSGFGFVITHAPAEKGKPTQTDEEKSAFARLLELHGGTVIVVENLYAVEVKEGGGNDVSSEELGLIFPKERFTSLNTILVISERPITTPKFLIALALKIPCVSRVFIDHSIEHDTCFNWKRYVLAAGSIHGDRKTTIVGTSLEALQKESFGIESIEQSYPNGLFKGLRFLVVVSKAGKSNSDFETHVASLRSIIVSAAAQTVHFTLASTASSTTGHGYDYVVLERADLTPKALSYHPGLCNVLWLKQCLIYGMMLPAQRFPEVADEG